MPQRRHEQRVAPSCEEPKCRQASIPSREEQVRRQRVIRPTGEKIRPMVMRSKSSIGLSGSPENPSTPSSDCIRESRLITQYDFGTSVSATDAADKSNLRLVTDAP